MITSVKATVAGLQIVDQPCGKCQGPMYIKPAPCFMRRHGWATVVKCVRCGFTAGYALRKPRRA